MNPVLQHPDPAAKLGGLTSQSPELAVLLADPLLHLDKRVRALRLSLHQPSSLTIMPSSFVSATKFLKGISNRATFPPSRCLELFRIVDSVNMMRIAETLGLKPEDPLICSWSAMRDPLHQAKPTREVLEQFASYIGNHDLDYYQISDRQFRENLTGKIRQWQALGLVQKRSEALQLIELHSTLGPQQHTRPHQVPLQLMNQSGAALNDWVSINELPQEPRAYGTYTLRRFKAISRQQFMESSGGEEFVNELQSENYPALMAEMQRCGLSNETIREKLRTGEALNLVEIEYFCQELQTKRALFAHAKGSLLDAKTLTAQSSTFAIIERQTPIGYAAKKVAITLGYQGAEHTGYGLRHIIYQRGQDGTIANLFPTTMKEEELFNTFLERGIYHVAGTARITLPSSHAARTHSIITGEIESCPGSFLTLVVASPTKTGIAQAEKVELVTALFHSSPTKVRNYLAKEMRSLFQSDLCGGERLMVLVQPINEMLARHSLSPITADEIGYNPSPEIMYRAPSGTGPARARRIGAVRSMEEADYASTAEMFASLGPIAAGISEEAQSDAEGMENFGLVGTAFGSLLGAL